MVPDRSSVGVTVMAVNPMGDIITIIPPLEVEWSPEDFYSCHSTCCPLTVSLSPRAIPQIPIVIDDGILVSGGHCGHWSRILRMYMSNDSI